MLKLASIEHEIVMNYENFRLVFHMQPYTLQQFHNHKKKKIQ